MSDAAVLPGAAPRLPRARIYPQREVPREGDLDAAFARWLAAARAPFSVARGRRFARLARDVARFAPSPELTDAELRAHALELAAALRAAGWPLPRPLVARTFGVIAEASARTLGMRHKPVQLMGAGAILSGMIAEMQTGEGKTLTATLAAIASALAGMPVHLITANDYLAARDAEEMGPLYRFFGLSVGVVVHGVPPEARRAAYAGDIVYCSNKEVAFDYLRDRMALRRRGHDLHLRAERLGGTEARVAGVRHRGLPFAIVDEADSVLIDEARIPLIISRSLPADEQTRRTYATALRLARALQEGRDYALLPNDRNAELKPEGVARIAEMAEELDGSWQVSVIREELVSKALAAIHLIKRDEHYLVRDGKVCLIDEYTGRLMPDRSLAEGLHQLVEMKEDVALSGARETMARMTYQRFFARYQRLGGMTGTARGVGGELIAVYGLPTATIPTAKPPRRIRRPDRHYPTADAKWTAVVARVAELHAAGRPVLIGTKSVESSQIVSARLEAAGIPHAVLNADQDAAEAEVVARAGEPGAITVATNMAGRGTDIKLGPGVAEAGGLFVLSTERHESGRIDRQLVGRCGRQGEPGEAEAFLSLEDDLVRDAPARMRALARLPGGAKRLFDAAQAAAEARHARTRRALMKAERHMADLLAFSGEVE
ncbi:translocase [Albimonas sp. CAU 1670]|uniref:preprotein translocase subunit SecA n=1 Tax=Albimonas sp. CAU 1670 TaxID=3032599 RepID=UPI0023DB957E|nr:translocase [Albimonas sp. CAU 1670]MDF2234972.1 translocase [Albimonas sp. CAU 1670]